MTSNTPHTPARSNQCHSTWAATRVEIPSGAIRIAPTRLIHHKTVGVDEPTRFSRRFQLAWATAPPATSRRTSGLIANDRSDRLATNCFGDVAPGFDSEHAHREVVVATQCERSRIDDLEPLFEGS